MLVPQLSIASNIFLGNERGGGDFESRPDDREAEKLLNAALG